MIVLDASVLIGYLFVEDAHHRAAVQIVQDAATEQLTVSQVTLAEVLVLPTRLGALQVALDAVRGLAIQESPLPQDGAVRLADLRVRTGMRLPDCCVLLAAQVGGGAVATFDQRLATAARGLGLRTVGEAGGG